MGLVDYQYFYSLLSVFTQPFDSVVNILCSISLLYCTQGGIDSQESITTVQKKITRMKEQLPTMTEMLERVDVEEGLERTDGVIENLVAEVQNFLLACL